MRNRGYSFMVYHTDPATGRLHGTHTTPPSSMGLTEAREHAIHMARAQGEMLVIRTISPGASGVHISLSSALLHDAIYPSGEIVGHGIRRALERAVDGELEADGDSTEVFGWMGEAVFALRSEYMDLLQREVSNRATTTLAVVRDGSVPGGLFPWGEAGTKDVADLWVREAIQRGLGGPRTVFTSEYLAPSRPCTYWWERLWTLYDSIRLRTPLAVPIGIGTRRRINIRKREA